MLLFLTLYIVADVVSGGAVTATVLGAVGGAASGAVKAAAPSRGSAVAGSRGSATRGATAPSRGAATGATARGRGTAARSTRGTTTAPARGSAAKTRRGTTTAPRGTSDALLPRISRGAAAGAVSGIRAAHRTRREHIPCPAVIVVRRVRGTRGTTDGSDTAGAATIDDLLPTAPDAPAATAPDGDDDGTTTAPTLRHLDDLEQTAAYGYRCGRCSAVTVPEPGAAAPAVCATCGTPDEHPERLHLISCRRCGSWCIVQGTGRKTVCPNPECNTSQGCCTTERGICAVCGTGLAVAVKSGAVACPVCRTQHITISSQGRHEVSADCGCEICASTLRAMRDRCPSCGDTLALNSEGIMACHEHGAQPVGVTEDQPEDAPSDGQTGNTTNTTEGDTTMNANTAGGSGSEDAGVVPYLAFWDGLGSLEEIAATLGAYAAMVRNAVEANQKYEGDGGAEGIVNALTTAEASVLDAMENLAVHARNLHGRWDPAVEALAATNSDVAVEVLGAR